MNDIFQGFESTTPPITLAAMEVGAPINTLSLAEEKRAEWFKQRWGKFTASEFYKLMGYEDRDDLQKGGITYARQKACEMMTECAPDTYVSPAMQWGIDHEHEAIDQFIERTGSVITDCKEDQIFLTLGDSIGGTPDGIITDLNMGIEIKCPSSAVHLDYLENVRSAASLKEAEDKYYWQIQGLMLITGFDSWWFVSYDPRYKNADLRIHAAQIARNDEDIAKLQRRLDQAIAVRDTIVSSHFGTDIGESYRKSVVDLAKENTSIKRKMMELMARLERLESK